MKHRLTAFFTAICISISAFSDNESLLFSPKGIAEVHITLDNGKNIDDIKRDDRLGEYDFFEAEKLSATMVIKNSQGSTYDEAELYNGKILIKGRGNTTWGLPKKPYSVDLVDGDGEDNPFGLLGMPAHEEWALVAFWHDRSWMRIPLAFYLGQHMSGLAYTPRLRYVEVYLNNEYRGMYCLSEKIERDKNRVDLKKLTDADEDQVEPRISGGYLLERVPDDKMKKKLELDTQIETGNRKIKLVFKYPKPKNVTYTQRMWIQNYLTEFENALYGPDFKDPEKGYQKYINEDSFIDWYILHDLSKGVDNLFHASIFLHKDRNDKLNMSAPWDFDISFGNVNHDECYYEDGLWIEKTHYFHQLLKDERFAGKLISRYDELMPLFNNIPQIIGTNLKQLEESGCIQRDKEKWPQILEEYKDRENRTTPSSVRGHAIWLKDWMGSRKTWLYMNLPGLTDDEKCERLKNSRPVIRVMDPESFEKGRSSDVKVMKGYTYIWNDTQTKNSEEHRINKNGDHWVQIKNEQGCLSLPSKVVSRGNIDDFEMSDETAIKELQLFDEQAMSVFNPVKEVCYINYISSKNTRISLSLYDIKGELVKEMTHFVSEGNNQFSMNVSGIPPGMYVLKCFTDSGSVVEKILKTD